MYLINTPLTVGDMFEKLFNLIGKTFLRNLMICLIIIVPVGLVLSWGIDSFFSQINEIADYRTGDYSPDTFDFTAFFGALGNYFLSILVFGTGYLAANLGIVIIGCSQVENKNLNWQDVLIDIFSYKLVKLILLTLLEILISISIFFVPFIVIVIGGAKSSGVIIFFGVILIIAAVLFMVYLFISWTFAIQAIGWEDLGVIDSLKRSFNLVKEYWWRTFGIILLFSIIIEFAVSIITTPVSLIVFWDMFAKMFESMGANGIGYDQHEMVKEVFSSFSERFGILIVLSTALKLLIQPLLTVVLYYDLKVRKENINDDRTDPGHFNINDVNFDSIDN